MDERQADEPSQWLAARVERLEQQVASLQAPIEQLLISRSRLRAKPVENSADQSLEARVQRLEQEVADLQELTGQLPAPEAGYQPKSSETGVNSPAPGSLGPDFKSLQVWENLLNRAGIALVLLGAGFFFKYSIDHHWLSPQLRVGGGIGLALVMLGMGMRLQKPRLGLSQILLGGSLGVFYLSGFFAAQVFRIWSPELALGFMVAVTLAAFYLSLRQKEAVLAVVATIGGLGAPFMAIPQVWTYPHVDFSGLSLYAGILLLGSSGVYWYQGWLSLLLTNALGGWVIIGITVNLASSVGPGAAWVTQMLVLEMWLLGGVLPLLRRGKIANPIAAGVPDLAAVFSPSLGLLMSQQLWPLPDPAWGGWMAVTAVAYGVGSLGLKSRAPTLALVAGLQAATALSLSLLPEQWPLLTGAGQALVLHGRARQGGSPLVRWTAHLWSGLVALVMIVIWMFYYFPGEPRNNQTSLSELLVMAAACWLGFRFLRQSRGFYLGFAYFFSLMWVLLQSLTWGPLIWSLEGLGFLVLGVERRYRWCLGVGYFTLGLSLLIGGIWVTLVESLGGLGLLGLGLGRRHRWYLGAGSFTLGAALLKLFIVDLENLEAIWRVSLMMGLGLGLLGLSYFYRGFWRRLTDSEEHQAPDQDDAPSR